MAVHCAHASLRHPQNKPCTSRPLPSTGKAALDTPIGDLIAVVLLADERLVNAAHHQLAAKETLGRDELVELALQRVDHRHRWQFAFTTLLQPLALLVELRLLPVPEQMWQGGRPSPSADVAAPSLSVLSSGTLAGRGALASQPGGRACVSVRSVNARSIESRRSAGCVVGLFLSAVCVPPLVGWLARASGAGTE